MRKLLGFGGRGLLEYIYILSISAGDIILTLLSSFDADRSREPTRSFHLVLFATPVKQVMITDHDPPRGDDHGLQEKS